MRNLLAPPPHGGDLVLQTLEDLGIDLILSIPGSQVLPMWDNLGRHRSLRLVVPRSERAGALMAEGYGRSVGYPAVLMNTLGPGVANELVGLGSALLSHAPVLAVGPFQPPWKRKRIQEVFQGLDSPAYLDGAVKCTRVVEELEEIPRALTFAYRECLKSPAGPVRVDISYPLLFARAGVRNHRAPQPLPPSRREAPLIYVQETKNWNDAGLYRHLSESCKERIAPDAVAAPLWPGINEPGFALPFALGAKLAFPRALVVVATSEAHLVGNLDTLAVAAGEGISLQLVGRSPRLARIADAFGVRFTRYSSPRSAPPVQKEGLAVFSLS